MRSLNVVLAPAAPTPPSYEDFKVRVTTTVPSGHRHGQHAFNVLHRMRPDLSEQVRGVYGLDPFYRDDVLVAFYKHVEANW